MANDIFGIEFLNIAKFKPLARHEENENADYSQKTSLGLGLYIASEIVLVHNGALNVTSTEREGTTFEITVPY